MRWTVEVADGVGEALKLSYKNGEISNEDVELIRLWVRQVENFGPGSLSKTWSLQDLKNEFDMKLTHRKESHVNFWNDHELTNKWSGYRSSSFSLLGRIIYKIEASHIKIVKVVKITANHSY